MSSIKFNDPEYAKQRQEVKPLSLEEVSNIVANLNIFFSDMPQIKEKMQHLIWEYENLKHSNEVKCQCCYKNTTADIDVNYELVNSKKQ